MAIPGGRGPLHLGVPGKVKMIVTVYEPGSPNYEYAKGKFKSVSQWREVIGGNEGVLKDPAHGNEHRLSLSQWATNADEVYLGVEFHFIPDDPSQFPKRQVK